MDQRKIWTQQQDQLRKLLAVKTHYDEAIQLFFHQHAVTHTAAISSQQVWSLQDEVLEGLSDEQLKMRLKPGTNSIVWLLWHITRIEDMTINFLVFDRPQVYDSEGWGERLGLPLRDVGASMDENDVAALSTRINVGALLAYRAEVGRSTRTLVPNLQPDLKEIVPGEMVLKLVEEGSISQKGYWLAEYYLNRPRSFFLTRTATSHNFIHLNEAGRIGKKLMMLKRA
jgi:hypothetical protein